MKINVVPKFKSLESVKATTIGMYVPKSPTAPFNSAHLDLKIRLDFTWLTTLAEKLGGGADD